MGASEILTPLRPVYTKKSTTLNQFIPFTNGIEGRKAGSVRPGIELRESSGNLQVRVAYQTSNDGITWANTTHVTSYTSTEGKTFSSSYTALTQAPYLRFGVEAQNTNTTTTAECAMASLILDLIFS